METTAPSGPGPAGIRLRRSRTMPAAPRLYRWLFRQQGWLRGSYRAGRLVRRWMDGHPTLFPCEVFAEIRVWLRSDDRNIEEQCLLNGTFGDPVPQVIRSARGPGRVFYDVGANIGLYALLAAVPACRPCRVYAFEPCGVTRERLEENIRLNGAEGCVEVLPLGLGDRARTVEIAVPARDSGRASLHVPPEAVADAIPQTVRIVPLDTLVAEAGLAPPTFLKVDVEGHELYVIRGARAVIERHRPALLLECNHLAAAAGWSAETLLAELEPLGYRFWSLYPSGARPVRPGEPLVSEDLLGLPAGGRADLLELRSMVEWLCAAAS